MQPRPRPRPKYHPGRIRRRDGDFPHAEKACRPAGRLPSLRGANGRSRVHARDRAIARSDRLDDRLRRSDAALARRVVLPHWQRRIANAASRYLRTHAAAGVVDRARPDVVGHVRAVAARHRPFAARADRASAVDHLQLSGRLCDGADYLWSDLRPSRPQAGVAGRDRHLRPRQRAVRDDAIDRRADCGAFRPGAGRRRRHRAGACRGARPLFRRACGA